MLLSIANKALSIPRWSPNRAKYYRHLNGEVGCV